MPSATWSTAWAGRWSRSTSRSATTDVYVVADLPDDESAAAVAFTVSAAGGATTSTVKLLTVEQADAALGLSVDYVPPGG